MKASSTDVSMLESSVQHVSAESYFTIKHHPNKCMYTSSILDNSIRARNAIECRI